MAAFRPRCRGLLSQTLVAAFLSACGGGDLLLPGDGAPEGTAPADIRVFDGDGQSGQIGEPLPEPLVVLVTDAQGNPVASATVVFQLTSAGDGANQPLTGLTDASGFAEAQPVLGDKLGLQTGEARVIVGATTALTTSFTAIARTGDSDNRPPEADFNWHCEGLSCEFTDTSSDDDGGVIAWSWQFGDGQTSQQAEPAHLYSGPGTYLVTLTVTDNDGSTDAATQHVDVSGPSPPEPNKSPDAEFEVHCSGRTCAFVDESKDDDGTVVAWQWSFGDGATSTERNPVHTYADSDKYEVVLIVTDNAGDIDAKDHSVEPED